MNKTIMTIIDIILLLMFGYGFYVLLKLRRKK